MSRYTSRTALAGVVVLAIAASSATARAADATLGPSPHQTRSPSMFEVPETVDPGQAFAVSILDPRTGSRLELWSIAPQDGNRDVLGSVTVEGSVVRLAAPTEPGSYQLRYVSAGGHLRASRGLEVAALPIVLSVPEQMRAGREAEVRWRGPARPGDMLRIVTSDTGAVLAEVPRAAAPERRTWRCCARLRMSGSMRSSIGAASVGRRSAPSPSA